MKSKILLVSTETSHINEFYLPYIKLLKKKGYEVHTASNDDETIKCNDKHFNITFTNKTFSIKNLKAYINLKKLIKNSNYDIIHCNTKVAGIITRLANKKIKSKIIYTAYNFEFYKGEKWYNCIINYIVEKTLSKYTDILITINEEDYKIAKEKFKYPIIKLIDGIGLPKIKIKEKEKESIKKELDIKENDFIFTTIGDLKREENQIAQIESIKELTQKYNNIKLLIIGEGNLQDLYERIIYLYNLEEKVKILEKRRDIEKILSISNCIININKSGGIPIYINEAMKFELPIITYDIKKYKNTIKIKDINELTPKMEEEIIQRKRVQYEIENYKIENVLTKVEKIYDILI